VALFVVVAAAVGGIAYATIPGSGGVVSACAGAKGDLRVIDKDAGETCKSSETALELLGASAATNFLQNGSPAGGALTGTYPNPDLAAGAVTTAAFGAIPTVKVARCCLISEVPSSFSPTKLAFDIESFDVGGMHDPAQPTRLTAPVSGVYLIVVNVVWPHDGGIGAGFREIELIVNGTGHLGFAHEDEPAPSSPIPQVITVPVKLNAGSYVEVQARQTSGAPLTISTVYPSTFSMTWTAPG
jgi:hypothetical protein